MIVHYANWVHSCREFKDGLKIDVKTWNNDYTTKNIQIVFVCSGDKTREDYEKSMEDMPWVALPFGTDEKRIE
jgi:hypothetical protein